MTIHLKQASAALFLGLIFLSGCQGQDDDAKKELAHLKEQLAQQQQREAERKAKELEQQQAQQIEAAREEGYKQAQEELEHKQFLEEEQKAEEQKKSKQKPLNENSAQQTANQENDQKNKKVIEKLARYPAFVITDSGYGALNLRGGPSTSSVSVTQLSDGQQVQVIATTNMCTATGCWVKVQVNGMTGYVNDAFLQKGKAPQNAEEGIY